MGGRGGLSQNKHIMFDKKSLAEQLRNKGIQPYNLDAINNNVHLSLAVEVAETLISLQREYGSQNIEGIVFGGKSDKGNDNLIRMQRNAKGSLDLVIDAEGIKKSKATHNRKLSRQKNTASTSVRDLVINNFGKSIYVNAKASKNRVVFDKALNSLGTYKSDDFKTNKSISKLAKMTPSRKNPTHNNAVNIHYAGEGFVKLVNNRRSNTGSDAMVIVKNFIQSETKGDFSNYGKAKARIKKKK